LLLAALFALRAGTAQPQDDPVRGTWRGTLKSGPTATRPDSGQGESAVTVTFVRKGSTYEGTITGVGGDVSAVPFTKVEVTGTRVALEASADSTLGRVAFAAELTLEGNAFTGTGTLGVGPHRVDVTLQLQRRPRQEVPQPTVKQDLAYFVGRWTFEYLGAEFPPLSAGTRTGAVTFSREGTSSFATGRVEGEVSGAKFTETLSIGFDNDTRAVVFVERRAGGGELMSVADWRSPLAINFKTAPVRAGGRTYQLRHVISIRSETAFDVTEEFSVDGGSYRRLGNSRFTKVP
jgi:hypothetical protein